jgi:hypothetical protein
MSLHIPLNFVPIIEGPLLHGVRAFPGNAVQYFCLLGFACPDVLGGSPVAAHFFAPHWYNPGNDQNLTRLRKLFSARFLVTTFSRNFLSLITIAKFGSQAPNRDHNLPGLTAIAELCSQSRESGHNWGVLIPIRQICSRSADLWHHPAISVKIG